MHGNRVRAALPSQQRDRILHLLLTYLQIQLQRLEQRPAANLLPPPHTPLQSLLFDDPLQSLHPQPQLTHFILWSRWVEFGLQRF